LFIKMSPLSVALRKKSNALYVEIKSASVATHLGKFLLTIENKRASIQADTLARYP
jgi:hypothetical protein